MGCRASRNKVMPAGIATIGTLRSCVSEVDGDPEAVVRQWESFVSRHHKWESEEDRGWVSQTLRSDGNGALRWNSDADVGGLTTNVAKHLDAMLTSMNKDVVWDDVSLEIVASSILVAKETTRVNLSPKLRAQLWLAFSQVDSLSTRKHSAGWGPTWYDDALSRAEEIASGSSKCESTKMNDGGHDATVKAFKVIDNDVPRTLHNFADFVYPDEEKHSIRPPEDSGAEVLALTRVLRAFCIVCPDTNYTQGMNFIAALFLLVLWYAEGEGSKEKSSSEQEEAETATPSTASRQRRREMRACGMLRVLAENMGMERMWCVGFPLLNNISESLMTLLGNNEPKVASRLGKNGLPPSSYTTSWLITLFTSGPKLKFASPSDLMTWWDILWVECCRPRVTSGQAKNSLKKSLVTSWRSHLIGAGSASALSTVVLRTTYKTLLCHKTSIVDAKDVVDIMNELRRELNSEEFWNLLLKEADNDVLILADQFGKLVGRR